MKMFDDIQILPRGRYLEIPLKITLLDEAIIRSNEPEEVLMKEYQNLGNRFILPWRKIKGKLRRLVMERQRDFGISKNCSLKDNLCMQCPSCLLFGGTGETSNANVPYNLLSRVMGETFISLEEADEVTPYTANAVDEVDQTTGQALMTIVTVPAGTEFIGLTVLKDPTEELASIFVNNLNRISRIGARSVEWGKVKTEILGAKIGDRESTSSLLLAENGGANGDFDEDLGELPDLKESYESVKETFDEKLESTLKKED